jgi:hypothetical protein
VMASRTLAPHFERRELILLGGLTELTEGGFCQFCQFKGCLPARLGCFEAEASRFSVGGMGREAARAGAQKAPKGALRRGRAKSYRVSRRSLTEGKRKPVSLGEGGSSGVSIPAHRVSAFFGLI